MYCNVVACIFNMVQGNVWICMEVMDVSLEFFYQKVHQVRGMFQEDMLSVIAFSVCLNLF